MEKRILIPIALLGMVLLVGCTDVGTDAAVGGNKQIAAAHSDNSFAKEGDAFKGSAEAEDAQGNNDAIQKSGTGTEDASNDNDTTQENDAGVKGTNNDNDATAKKDTGNDDYQAVSQKGWYIRISTQTDKRQDSNTVFGYLQGASDGKDRYDSEALKSSGLYATIYHEDYGNTKNYRSDYRADKETGTKSETWLLRVNSGDADADVTMSWDGITFVEKKPKGGFAETQETSSPELDNMRLVDVESGEIIDVATTSSYQFNMGGQKSKEFKWLMLADGEDEPLIK